MKKIILMTVLLSLALATYSFAACSQPSNSTTFSCTGSSPNWVVNVSKSIFMDYSVNATDTTAKWYTIATGHASGDKIFAASQADTKIFYKVDSAIVVGDVQAADLTPAATSPYDGVATWTAM